MYLYTIENSKFKNINDFLNYLKKILPNKNVIFINYDNFEFKILFEKELNVIEEKLLFNICH